MTELVNVPPPIRRDDHGCVAIRDERIGGQWRPWTVHWTAVGVRVHYATQALTDLQVATWALHGPVPEGVPA